MALGFGAYSVSTSGMSVNQKSLDVTSHNISNINKGIYVENGKEIWS